MSQFEKFLSKVQEPMESSNYGVSSIHKQMISDIAHYLQGISAKKAHGYLSELKIIDNYESSENSIACDIISQLITNFAGIPTPTQNFPLMVKNRFIIESLAFSFQRHLEKLKKMKYELNEQLMELDKNDEDTSAEKDALKNMFFESCLIFKYWLILHQDEQRKKNPKYNFFNIQKSNHNLPNIGQDISFQNFDHIKFSQELPAFFVLTIMTNLADIEMDEEVEPEFYLVGIYLFDEKITSYRYKIKSHTLQSNMKFLDAMNMLIVE